MSSPYDPAAQGGQSLLDQALERIKQLEDALKATTATGDNVPKLAGPTHDLYLANGDHVESTGAIPTHVSFEDGRVVPVLTAVAR